MKRRVAAWPVGIIGNIVLFTVFLGGVFNTPNDLNLYGQAGRQVFFLIVSIYGWVRWAQFKKSHGGEASGYAPSGLAHPPAAAADRRGRDDHRLLLHPQGAGLLGPASGRVDPYRSILATYGMARGWVEFWLVWIAVDLVGVKAGCRPSSTRYSDVHRLRSLLCHRFHLLAADRAP